MDTDAEREARRAHRRATMQVRKTTLHDRAGASGLWGPTSVAERLALVAELSQAGWLMTRRPLPTYRRHEMPVRIIRRSAARTG